MADSPISSVLDRLGPWPARVTWFVLPVLVGPAVSSGLDDRSGAVQVVAEIMLWVTWFAGLVCLLAPSTVSLTLYRLIAPAPIVAVIAVAVTSDVSTAQLVIAALAAGLSTAVAFLPLTGDVMVNGSAYGPERRLALRTPGPLLLGPILLAWLALAGTAVAGPLLMASGNWIAGLPLTLAAAGLGYAVGRSMHQLSRRWIVFTPAGLVIHDYFVLAESILLRRQDIAGLGPAPSEPRGTIDLSAGALGLALQIEAKEPLSIVVRNGRSAAATDTVRMIFSPSLPGKLLREARVRGITVS